MAASATAADASAQEVYTKTLNPRATLSFFYGFVCFFWGLGFRVWDLCVGPRPLAFIGVVFVCVSVHTPQQQQQQQQFDIPPKLHDALKRGAESLGGRSIVSIRDVQTPEIIALLFVAKELKTRLTEKDPSVRNILQVLTRVEGLGFRV